MFIKLENLNHCRICTKPEENVPFISVFGADSKIALKIYLISGIQIVETPEISSVICSQCVEDLNNADELRKKCIDAEEFFRVLTLQPEISYPDIGDQPEISYPDNTENSLFEESIKPCSSKAIELHHEPEEIESTKTNKKPKSNKKIKKRYQKNPTESITCPICHKVLKNKYCLTSHEKIFHTELPPPVKCPTCFMTFKREPYLIAHQKLMHFESYIPTLKTTVKKPALPPPAPVECPKCLKMVKSEAYLKTHDRLKHTKMSEIDPSELFYCDLCSYKAKTKTNLKNHIAFNHIEKDSRIVFICATCGKESPSKKALMSHEMTHIKSEVECPICSKIITSKYQLTVHIRTVHERSLTVACPDCDHIASCKAAFDKHYRRVHLKLKDHLCSECGSGFSTLYQLKAHFRIHTGERPYNCSFCYKDFRLLGAKARHERICPKRTIE